MASRVLPLAALLCAAQGAGAEGVKVLVPRGASAAAGNATSPPATVSPSTPSPSAKANVSTPAPTKSTTLGPIKEGLSEGKCLGEGSPHGHEENEGSKESKEDLEEAPSWVKKGFVVLIIGVLVSFWALAVLVEEYFVPGLTVLCNRLQLSDNVAGATFMAAGSSMAELFCSLISLFISHSSLGAGTVIGSALFNHTIIVGGSILYSKSGFLVLDPRVIVRDCSFYALSVIALVFAVTEVGDQAGKDCGDWVYMRWYHGFIMVALYGAYVCVCAYWEKIVASLWPYPEGEFSVSSESEEGGTKGEVDDCESTHVSITDDLEWAAACRKVHGAATVVRGSLRVAGDAGHRASIKSVTWEPPQNFTAEEERRPGCPVEGSGLRRSRVSHATHQSTLTDVLSMMSSKLLEVIPGGGKLYTDREKFDADRTECMIWRKKYATDRFWVRRAKMWDMRWAVIDEKGFQLYSRPGGGECRALNIYQGDVTARVTDPHRNIFELRAVDGKKERVVIFQAQDPERTASIVAALQQQIAARGRGTDETGRPEADASYSERMRAEWARARKIEEEANAGGVHSLIAWPHSTFGQIMHVLLFPFKASIHYTIPDIRTTDSMTDEEVQTRTRFWPLTNLMCIIWIGVWSYVMTYCCESLGELLKIDALVMGMTLSAAGTSFPDTFASILVARQGFSNMAVSNAFGSNIFDILLALGLPWLLICIFGTPAAYVDGMVYHGVKQGGTGFPILLVAGVLVIFLVVLCVTRMRLYKSHAFALLAAEVAFVVWCFVAKAQGPDVGF